ncbi:hypothetical protein CHS0354_010965 [Potamilus streckersoni]|uniref:Uncharacterized protein n=1 Tax=Potamilus streckersoni TaxID=2493646 RepID=A0AAE0W0C3_9BIVA|nr:hypothetical protein CHS0354_010965 [Potamilus streckersoni]
MEPFLFVSDLVQRFLSAAMTMSIEEFDGEFDLAHKPKKPFKIYAVPGSVSYNKNIIMRTIIYITKSTESTKKATSRITIPSDEKLVHAATKGFPCRHLFEKVFFKCLGNPLFT